MSGAAIGARLSVPVSDNRPRPFVAVSAVLHGALLGSVAWLVLPPRLPEVMPPAIEMVMLPPAPALPASEPAQSSPAALQPLAAPEAASVPSPPEPLPAEPSPPEPAMPETAPPPPVSPPPALATDRASAPLADAVPPPIARAEPPVAVAPAELEATRAPEVVKPMAPPPPAPVDAPAHRPLPRPRPRPRAVHPVAHAAPVAPPLPARAEPRAEIPKTSAAPAASPVAARASAPAVVANWQRSVSVWLERHKRYPAVARSRGDEGAVSVHMRVMRDGRIVSVAIVRSSGSEVLDGAVHAMLDGQSLPPFPADMMEPTHDVVVTLRYELEQ